MNIQCKAAIPSGNGWSSTCAALAAEGDIFCQTHGGQRNGFVRSPIRSIQSVGVRSPKINEQCIAITKYGGRCHQFRTKGSNLCYVHSPKTLPIKEGDWHDDERMASEREPVPEYVSALAYSHSLPFHVLDVPFSEMLATDD